MDLLGPAALVNVLHPFQCPVRNEELAHTDTGGGSAALTAEPQPLETTAEWPGGGLQKVALKTMMSMDFLIC